MIEIIDTAPAIDVDSAEYARLLGYPRGHELTGRAAELAQWARSWYAEHGRPWLYARQCRSLETIGSDIRMDGATFNSPRLAQTLTAASASSAFLVAVSAGVEAEAEAQRLWREEKPDEYFFLEIYGSAVVEHLTTITGARLCAWADGNAMAVLPHYSPGYPEWEIGQQPRLLEIIARERPLPQPIEALPSGMLRPKKSLLAVFGLTAHTERVQRLTSLVPCQNCSIARCDYRRVPYRRGVAADAEVAAVAGEKRTNGASHPLPTLSQNTRYLVNRRALQRWARDRLTLTAQSDGTTDAHFRFEGTTCSNMGRALHFHYHVKLGPREEGYPVREMTCTPAPGDEGYKSMCRYLSHPQQLMQDIQQDKSLVGKPLEEILNADRPAAAPSCYCEAPSRRHKWGLVFETIHFALAQPESSIPAATATKEIR